MIHLNYSLKDLGKTFQLQKKPIKSELKPGVVFTDSWRDKKEDWFDLVKKDVLGTGFSFARYSKPLEELIGFGMKDYLNLLRLGLNYFN